MTHSKGAIAKRREFALQVTTSSIDAQSHAASANVVE
jgi:hypothetical protein